MRVLPATAILMLIGAGCLDAETSTPQGEQVTKRPIVEAYDPPRWENSTVFHETIEFSRTEDAGQARPFTVPAGSRSATLYWTTFMDCPVSFYERSARFIVTNGDVSASYGVRNGTQPLVPESDIVPFFCTSVPPRTDPIATGEYQMGLEPAAGEWEIQTTGQCACSVAFRVEVEIPA